MQPVISESTYGSGLKFKLHATREEAVQHLLDEIGPDYKEKFWASKDGRHVVQSNHTLDFGVFVYDNIKAAINGQMNLDPDVLALALRRIADAIDAWDRR